MLSHSKRSILLLPVIATALLACYVQPAGAASEIEGVWSFNGGQIAIHALPTGKFEGVVVTATQFDECSHPAGEEMWTGITLQPDGSYWGQHRWLFAGSCAPNPVWGPTAWRVKQSSGGSHLLLVCFSEPGKSQPTIDPNGVAASSTFGCRESAPTAPLPVVSHGGSVQKKGAERISFRKAVLLPKAGVCVKQRSLKIKLRNPKYAPLKQVIVRVGGRKIADIHGVQRLKRAIVLKGLPTGTYTIKVVATTVLDQRLSGRRTYHSCKKHAGKVRLHRLKPHRHR